MCSSRLRGHLKPPRAEKSLSDSTQKKPLGSKKTQPLCKALFSAQSFPLASSVGPVDSSVSQAKLPSALCNWDPRISMFLGDVVHLSPEAAWGSRVAGSAKFF